MSDDDFIKRMGWVASMTAAIAFTVLFMSLHLDPYQRVDECQHRGLTRTQCWCLEKASDQAEGIQRCVLGAKPAK